VKSIGLQKASEDNVYGGPSQGYGKRTRNGIKLGICGEHGQ
jgi:hypothetical protein